MVKNPKYTLCWKGIALGVVEQTEAEFPWLVGKYMPEDLPPMFKPLFEYMTSESSFEQDPPFDAELLSDENWLLMSEDGEEIGYGYRKNGFVRAWDLEYKDLDRSWACLHRAQSRQRLGIQIALLVLRAYSLRPHACRPVGKR